MRPRDSQRAKLYRAEGVLKAYDQEQSLGSIAHVECFLDTVSRTRFFHSLWEKQRAYRPPSGPAIFKLTDGRGTRHARGSFGGYRQEAIRCPTCGHHTGYLPKIPTVKINAPPFSRYPRFMLHELAHAVIPRHAAWHGREFAAVFLALVRRFMGAEAATALRASFREHGVKARQPGPSRKLTPDQRRAAIERLATARAAKMRED